MNDYSNMVLLDKRDLFDAVRGALKEQMEALPFGDAADLWAEATSAADECLRDLVSKAPVPPAGDVEVLGYVSFVGKDHVRVTLDCPAPTLNTQVVNRVYATQLEADCQALQSERDGLLAEVARLKEERDGIGGLIEKLNAMTYARDLAHRAHMREQSELTKARNEISQLGKGND